jgi:hypothetical protein
MRHLLSSFDRVRASEEQIVFPKTQPVRFITSGSVTEVAVPELGSMASLTLGIMALMGLAFSKQIRSVRTIFLWA